MQVGNVLFCFVMLGMLSVSQQKLVGRFSFQQVLDQKLYSNYTVIGADDYLTLFIWKSLNISSLEEVYLNKSIRFFSYTYNSSLLSTVMERVIPSHNTKLKKRSFQALNSWTYQRTYFRRGTDCMRGSVFENFDILIDTPQVFAKRIRTDRAHMQTRKKSNEFLNPNDFLMVPLFPLRVWMVSNSDLISDRDIVNEEMINIMNNNASIVNLTCSDSIIHDSRTIERHHGIINFTQSEMNMFSIFLNISHLNYTNSVANHAISMFESQHFSMGLPYFSMDDIDKTLWTSTCHFCTTSSCIGESWSYTDWLDIIVVAIGILFYILLFSFKLFMNPVFKRRLGLCFLGPFFNMVLFVSLSESISSGCKSAAGLVVVYSVSCLVSIYCLTIARYYYLRNLYWFLENSKITKLHKILSNYWIGMILTTGFPLIFCVIFTIPEIILFSDTWDISVWDLSVNISILLLALLSSLLGFFCISLDLWVNRKVIKEKGFRYFFTFQDPIFVRIDLLSLVVIIVLLVMVVIDSTILTSTSSIGIFRFLTGLCVYMILGGNSMIVVLIMKILSKSSHQTNEETVDEFIALISDKFNQSFYTLLRDYCINENSLENIMIFDVLKDLRASNCVRLQDLESIKKIHLESLSAYEVNVSHATKSKINTLIRYLQMNPEKTIQFEQIEFLRVEVVLNIKDSYSRFAMTHAFKDWKRVNEIQKKNNV